MRFYAQFIAPGDLCFDIGANRGLRTKIYRRLGARVVAVEPQSSCMNILRAGYGGDADVTLVQAACGSAVGRGVMRVCDADILSSMSDEWITAVHTSGRFNARWEKQEPCSLLTVDVLVEQYGSPAFIKIDVEGYELNVLQGMSRAVPCLSFEFTPERFSNAVECVDYLYGLGFGAFNASWGESFEMALPSWVLRDEIVTLLGRYRDDAILFGDVYARAR